MAIAVESIFGKETAVKQRKDNTGGSLPPAEKNGVPNKAFNVG